MTSEDIVKKAKEIALITENHCDDCPKPEECIGEGCPVYDTLMEAIDSMRNCV